MRKGRHRLDLLPLLDVFIVVLFVFATVHERKIDESTQARQELSDRVAQLERELARQQGGGADQAQVIELRARAQTAERRLEAMREQTAAALERWATAEDAARDLDVYRKLLDHFTVFEIELAGVEGPGADVVNRCCYRVDVEAGAWRACEAVPADREERRAWIARGGGGLVDALRRTKGGNAMTIVRQDSAAAHRIGSKLGDVLREQFPGHQIYAGGVAPSHVDCTAE